MDKNLIDIFFRASELIVLWHAQCKHALLPKTWHQHCYCIAQLYTRSEAML